jgi:transcriptional regulator NrdR family protein
VGMNKHIVKRHGHTEAYDERKLYASVFNACTTHRMSDQEAELIAAEVTKQVTDWLGDKHEVTSGDISRIAGQHFNSYNETAAYLYKHHRSIS